MHRSSEPVQVATGAPLLRAVLVILVLIAVVAGVLVASSAQVGWLALGVGMVLGPVAVMVDGRARRRSEAAASLRASPERTEAPDVDRTGPPGQPQRTRPIPVTSETSAAPM